MKHVSLFLVFVGSMTLGACQDDRAPAAQAPAAPGEATTAPTAVAEPGPVQRVRVPLKPGLLRGAADALITMVVASDYECPFCVRVERTIDQLLKANPATLRVQMLMAPLPMYENGRLPAEAAAIANSHGKFWEYHDRLFAAPQQHRREDLVVHAAAVGLDPDEFGAALDRGDGRAAVDRDVAIAAAIGARGRPTFFLNGRKVVGAVPIATLQQIIDEEIATAKELLGRGIHPSAIYGELTKNAPVDAVTTDRQPPADPPPPAGCDCPQGTKIGARCECPAGTTLGDEWQCDPADQASQRFRAQTR
jgi:protein-disulfide isomerase